MSEYLGMFGRCRLLRGLAVFLFLEQFIWAGGSGLNTVIVVNQLSTNSVQLGNYYAEKRGVPARNVLRISWSGNKVAWSRSDFESALRAPLQGMLVARGISNQVDRVLLSMDIPYRIQEGGGATTSGTNSTTSALFYGFKPDGLCPVCPLPSCSLPAGSDSDYAGSEGIFRETPPISVSSNSWLTMMLTATNINEAKRVVDRAIGVDATHPTQTAFLVRHASLNTDPFRTVRWTGFDNTVFDCRILSNLAVERRNLSSVNFQPDQLGQQNGLLGAYPIANLIAPGGLADNLTSYGGNLLENGHHPGALDYLVAGAAASYGTVVEPCSYREKFPSPQNYFYQSRGFSAVECYYLSVTNPYQGILVGDPLCAPFANPGSGSWQGIVEGALLSGVTNLSCAFVAAGADQPIGHVDLFIDDKLVQSITNLPPAQNNRIYVTLRGFQRVYTVPSGATLKSVATALATSLNNNTYRNNTKVTAEAIGDRLLLYSTDLSTPASAVTFTVSNYIHTASALTTHASASGETFLETTAFGLQGCGVTNAPGAGGFLQLTVTKTNGNAVNISVPNPSANTSAAVLVQALIDSVNTNASLTGSDGVIAEDFIDYAAWLGQPWTVFNIRPRSPGWAAAQIQVRLLASATMIVGPLVNTRLDQNVTDLRPRAHLYIGSGVTNLPVTIPFNTTAYADGYHELTAVAYEGTHVQTQTRATVPVRLQNSNLTATFECLYGGENTDLNAIMQFRVQANGGGIQRIELHTTGGLYSTVNSQSSAVFSVPATHLQIGLHPFHALVLRNDGVQYQTETKWIRIIGPEPAFSLHIINSPATLRWPATAGRLYEILSATNLANVFNLRGSTIPSNSVGRWSEANVSASGFYRVRAQPN